MTGVSAWGPHGNRILAIKLQERRRPLAKVGVIEAPRVKLEYGFFHTIERPTSVPTPPNYTPMAAPHHSFIQGGRPTDGGELESNI